MKTEIKVQRMMPFRAASGVGLIYAVENRYGGGFGVSWASTSIAEVSTWDEAVEIARRVAEDPSAVTIADMRRIAGPRSYLKVVK